MLIPQVTIEHFRRLGFQLLMHAVLCIPHVHGMDFITDTTDMHSDILREKRTILVFKPSVLNSTDSVSILYLLEDEYSAYFYNSVQNNTPNNQLIGIGIMQTNRRRDMLAVNNADRFIRYIENELIPVIEDHYCVNNRILFGHSIEGGFVVHTMLKSPGLFDKYIASSPTPLVNHINTYLYSQLDTCLESTICFYYSWGSRDMKQVRKYGGLLQNNLIDLHLTNIIWKNEVFDGENHSTSGVISLYKGLRF